MVEQAYNVLCSFLIFCLLVFQHGTPPLLIAAGCGNIQMLELLIKRGAHIDVQDKVSVLYKKMFCLELKGHAILC